MTQLSDPYVRRVSNHFPRLKEISFLGTLIGQRQRSPAAEESCAFAYQW